MSTDDRVAVLATELQELRRRCSVSIAVTCVFAVIGAVVLARLSHAHGPRVQDLDAVDIVGRSLSLRTEDGHVWFSAFPLDTGGEVWVRTRTGAGVQLRAEESQKFVGVTALPLAPQHGYGVFLDADEKARARTPRNTRWPPSESGTQPD